MHGKQHNFNNIHRFKKTDKIEGLKENNEEILGSPGRLQLHGFLETHTQIKKNETYNDANHKMGVARKNVEVKKNKTCDSFFHGMTMTMWS